MKKFYFLFLMMLLPLAASADAVQIEGIYYNLNAENKTAEVTSSRSKYSGDIAIPKSVTYEDVTYSVTSIGQSAFSACRSLTSIEIPNSVTSIGKDAFYVCDGLTSITIPNGVISIESGAFHDCKGLTSITIPSTVTSIGYYVFSGCSGLTSIVVEAGNTVYDSRDNCNAIIETASNTLIRGCETTVFPNNVTSIGMYAFTGCSGLTSVTIPKSVTSIETPSFSDCNNLTSIVVESGNTVYDSRDNCNAIIETAHNYLVAGCNTTVIPNGVTSIIGDAFRGCKGLTSVEIPNSVTSISGRAFSSCDGLTSVTIPNSVTYLGSEAFYGCVNLTSVKISNSLTSILVGVFHKCSSLTSVEIPNSVTSIGDLAFASCRSLTSVEIPSSVTTIGQGAFAQCSGLTAVTIPNSVTSIGEGAFEYCSSLTSVTSLATTPPQADENAFEKLDIPLYVPKGTRDAYLAASPWNKFKEIIEMEESSEGEESVALDPYVIWCEDNTTLYFLGNGDDISNSSYKGHAITQMWHGETVTKLPENSESYAYHPVPWALNYIFPQCTSVVIDESFKNVRVTSTSGWFAGCHMQTIEGIEYLNTSEVTSMSYMFGCPNLTSLDVSHFDTRKVKYMQDLFGGCKKLETIDLSNFDTSNVVDMAMMFRACNALKTLDLSNLNTSKVTNLTWMFLECYALTTVDLTNFNTSNVITMNNMFQSCSSLTSLDLTGFNTEKVTEMEGVFYDCSSLKTLDVSHFNTSNVTKMSMMFCGCSGLTNLDVSHFNTSKVTSMRSMFGRCSGLTSLDLRNFSTENVTEMSGLVGQCTNLETLDLSSFNTANVTSIDYMFYDCSNLNTIYASDKWSISNVTYEFGMDVFVNCTKLVGGKGTTYKDGYSDFTFAHIDGGSSNPGYFTFKDGGESPAEETEEVITITGAGQTTWCSASDLDFTGVEGLKAYTATGYNRTTGTIWLTRVQEVPANEGILLIGDPGEYKVPQKSTTTYYMNMFKGTLEPITINEAEGEYTNYYLSNGASGVGFYKVEGTRDIGANRAYLPLLKGTTQAGTRFIGIEFEDDGTTGVKEVKSGEVKGEEWFTLQGQRVAKPGKGLYIRNGKKVVVR